MGGICIFFTNTLRHTAEQQTLHQQTLTQPHPPPPPYDPSVNTELQTPEIQNNMCLNLSTQSRTSDPDYCLHKVWPCPLDFRRTLIFFTNAVVVLRQAMGSSMPGNKFSGQMTPQIYRAKAHSRQLQLKLDTMVLATKSCTINPGERRLISKFFYRSFCHLIFALQKVQEFIMN